MSKNNKKFNAWCSDHGLSLPNAGGIWRNKATGIDFVVMSKGIGMILVRERGDESGEPIRLTDFVGFYREFSYVGKELA